jgi:hypothetical protein
MGDMGRSDNSTLACIRVAGGRVADGHISNPEEPRTVNVNGPNTEVRQTAPEASGKSR